MTRYYALPGAPQHVIGRTGTPPLPDGDYRALTKAPAPERRVLVGALFREHQKRVTFREAPPPAPVRRPAHMARMLALAHHLQSAIDRGLMPDWAEVERRLGLTRARVTQFLDLLLLAPDLQDQVLHLEAVDGAEPLSERALRAVAHAGSWGSSGPSGSGSVTSA